MSIEFYLKAEPKHDGELRVLEFYKFHQATDEKAGHIGISLDSRVDEGIIKEHSQQRPKSDAYIIWRKYYEANKAACDKRALAGEEVYLPEPEAVKVEDGKEKKGKEK